MERRKALSGPGAMRRRYDRQPQQRKKRGKEGIDTDTKAHIYTATVPWKTTAKIRRTK